MTRLVLTASQTVGPFFHDCLMREDARCDNDRTSLIQREDDKESAVARRLNEYDERTAPLIDYYEHRALFHQIDGYRPKDIVFKELARLVEAGA